MSFMNIQTFMPMSALSFLSRRLRAAGLEVLIKLLEDKSKYVETSGGDVVLEMIAATDSAAIFAVLGVLTLFNVGKLF